MSEIRDIIRKFESAGGQPLALATLVRAQGSSYRRPGARMLIAADGSAVGSLSGGCLEEEVAERGGRAIRTGEGSLMSFDTRRRFGCHGAIDVFVERVAHEFLEELAECFHARSACEVRTVFAGEPNELGTFIGAENESDPAHVLVQIIPPSLQLLVFGEGPDSEPLVALADLLGWKILQLNQASELPAELDAWTAAVVKTHNYGRDFTALQALLPRSLKYVGLVGPRRRRDQLLGDLLDLGITIDSHLFAPAGLDLRAETPEEIALSIVSEIQSVFAGGTRVPLRDAKTPIHVIEQAPPPACEELQR